MHLRPLIFGILFIGIFVALILSLMWVDNTHPVREQNPLAPTGNGQVAPGGGAAVQQ